LIIAITWDMPLILFLLRGRWTRRTINHFPADRYSVSR
jgi:hypothetical protein